MKKILVLAEYYEPFVKGGGPIQSIKNIVNNMYNKFDFKIITRDRDIGDEKASPEIVADKWQDVEKAKVYYTEISAVKVINLLKNTEYDTIYLNSLFAPIFSILPVILHRFNIIKNKKIILAPRGELSLGALGLKNTKKRLFIIFAKIIGLYKRVYWHATAETERQDILRQFKKVENIKIANNLTADYSSLTFKKDTPKEKGKINLVFVSRIHPKKNIKYAISILKHLEGDINYKIYGPIEAESYWAECKDIIYKLQNNCKVSHEGMISHDSVIDIMQENHVFLFPTLGENYGHVISEALIGGCPVVISDQTPWRQLEDKQVGFDIPLDDEEQFIKAIQYYIDLNQDEYLHHAEKAFLYGIAMSNKEQDIDETYKLLNI